MNFGFSEEQSLLRDSVRKLMDRHAPADTVAQLDREQAYPYELYDAWVEAGLLRLPFRVPVHSLLLATSSRALPLRCLRSLPPREAP